MSEMEKAATTTPPHGPVILNVCCNIGVAPAPLVGQHYTEDWRMMTKPKAYEDAAKCPERRCRRMGPLFIVLISLLEIGVFVYDYLTVTVRTELNASVAIPSESVLIYRPDRRLQLWRFISYMVLHANCFHLGFNVIVQLAYGMPLEMQHGSLRVGVIYVAGVFAGSLGTSVVDSDVYLVGASGGVYALLAAQLANILLNFQQMRYGIAQLMAVLIFAFCDLGYALYIKYHPSELRSSGGSSATTALMMPSVSYVAHVAGTLAGFTLGLLILKQLPETSTATAKHLQSLTWLAVGIYAAFTIFAIVFNLINTTTAQRLEQDTEQWSAGWLHQWGIT